MSTLKKYQKLVFKINYRLMQVKSIAKYFWPSLSYHLSLKIFDLSTFEWRFTQVLLYKAYSASLSIGKTLVRLAMFKAMDKTTRDCHPVQSKSLSTLSTRCRFHQSAKVTIEIFPCAIQVFHQSAKVTIDIFPCAIQVFHQSAKVTIEIFPSAIQVLSVISLIRYTLALLVITRLSSINIPA